MVPYRRLLQSSLFVPLGHQLKLLPLGQQFEVVGPLFDRVDLAALKSDSHSLRLFTT